MSDTATKYRCRLLPAFWRESNIARMKRSLLPTLALLLVALPVAASAADSPNTYTDPAMSFTPPASFTRFNVAAHDPLRFEEPAVMAFYARGQGTQKVVTISLRMDQFRGDVNAWATTEDNELRANADGAFIKRTATTLANGMPAMWEEVTVGSGFDQIKTYRYLWADGARGVELSETGRDIAIDEPTAKKDLAQVTAVAYPINRY
jgi:hypothetical protein